MSGIVGLLRRDGREAGTADATAMLDKILHRGPDHASVWASESAALGNCLLRTTPESLLENLPCESRVGPFVIAADARIDNRDELNRTLHTVRTETPTDSELILRAYAQWGESCPERLIGDFSFVIWDKREKKMFCARDSAGVRSLYYFASPRLFATGSEIKSLLALTEIPAFLNEQRVGDYLINLFEDRAITFYKDIYRLPAAHTLTVSRDAFKVRNYWKLDPAREIRLRNDNEYAEAFREIFDEAVRCRVRSVFPVGAALSGGLDSSAIACTARNLIRGVDPQATLHSFSVVFPGAPESDLRSIDEREYVDSVLSTGSFNAHFIHGDRLNPLSDYSRIHHHLDEPNLAPNLYLHWAMYVSAQENGVRVFLDGLDGDTTVSHGFELLDELARGFRWRRLYKEASALSANLFEGSNPRRILWRYCFRDMAPDWTHRVWRLLHGRFGELRGNSTLTHPDFARRLRLRQRAHGLLNSAPPRTAREYHHKALRFSLYAHALEMADKASAAFGVEARYPFFDRRLIEFCLALPAGQKLAAGWNRAVFRRAMEGVLPAEVQWRRSKGNLSSNFHRKLLDCGRETLEGVAADQTPLFGAYVDMAAMRKSLDCWKASPLGAGGRHSIHLFAAANLALWMKQTGLQPVSQAAPKTVQKKAPDAPQASLENLLALGPGKGENACNLSIKRIG